MYKTIVGPDGKVIEVSDINYPVVKADTYTTEEVKTMLEELKSDIADKFCEPIKNYDYGFNCGLELSMGEIQERINAL